MGELSSVDRVWEPAGPRASAALDVDAAAFVGRVPGAQPAGRDVAGLADGCFRRGRRGLSHRLFHGGFGVHGDRVDRGGHRGVLVARWRGGDIRPDAAGRARIHHRCHRAGERHRPPCDEGGGGCLPGHCRIGLRAEPRRRGAQHPGRVFHHLRGGRGAAVRRDPHHSGPVARRGGMAIDLPLRVRAQQRGIFGSYPTRRAGATRPRWEPIRT